MNTKTFSSSVFLVMFAFSALQGQTDSVSTFDEDETDFRMTVGLSGGIGLVNPSQLNDQLAFVNNSLDVGMEKITVMQNYAAFVKIKPRLAPYMLMRVEALTASRSFNYDAVGRSVTGASTGSFNVYSKTRWTVYPLIIGAGTTIPKTPIDVEVAAIYALGYIAEEGSTEGSGSYTNNSSGDGFGLQGRVAPHYRFSKNVILSFEISYRFLVIRDYSDNLGRKIRDFELFLNGISTCLSIGYTFD